MLFSTSEINDIANIFAPPCIVKEKYPQGSSDISLSLSLSLSDMSDNETDVEDEAGGSPRHHQPAHAATIHSIPEEKEDMGNASLEMTKQQQKEEEGIINH